MSHPVVSFRLECIARRFLANGGRVEQRRVSSLADVGALAINGSFDCVFNCLGLGARDIFGDLTLYPQRGQLYKARRTCSTAAAFIV